jgi:hypothetical protein
MSANNVLHVDPGPLARFRETIEDPTTLSVIVQRVTDGETLKEIAKSPGRFRTAGSPNG